MELRQLQDLLPDVSLPTNVVVSGITDDSREVKDGDLFLAAPGLSSDGRDFISDAVARSVSAIFCEPPVPQYAKEFPVYEVLNLNDKKGELASRFYGDPTDEMCVIGVTGTNGKTSCSMFIASALNLIGERCGVIGTLGSGMPDALCDPGLTTPDAITLQRKFSELRSSDCKYVAVEASSHGLAQGRLKGTSVDIAVLTNITRDHLDYHETFGDYKSAKRSLFQWPALRTAIINVDDESAEDFIHAVGEDVTVITYGATSSAADVYCESLLFREDGFEAEVITPWGRGNLTSGLLGEFNVNNLLAVVAVLGSMEIEIEKVIEACSRLGVVPGRMEMLKREGAPAAVIDYAHTPDALEKALSGLRTHCVGDLWCVVGCGGDRDKGKRPLMGKIVASLADRVVITDDNPRDEPSRVIIEDVLAEVEDLSNIHIESDRAAAIAYALMRAGEDDIVLIAGKGHEDYQAVGGKKIPFSDHAEVSKYFGAN